MRQLPVVLENEVLCFSTMEDLGSLSLSSHACCELVCAFLAHTEQIIGHTFGFGIARIVCGTAVVGKLCCARRSTGSAYIAFEAIQRVQNTNKPIDRQGFNNGCANHHKVSPHISAIAQPCFREASTCRSRSHCMSTAASAGFGFDAIER